MIDVIKTRGLWDELHTFAKESKVILDQVSFITNWFGKAFMALGCVSCWFKVSRFCDLWPVAYGEGLYLWSICLHDYVNKEMGRPLFFPELTLEPLTAKGIMQ